MFGIIFIYWIGRYFFKLAEKYEKNEWGYAILGVVVYYVGTILFGFIIGVILGILAPDVINDINDRIFGILMIPIGILCDYGLYKYLEKTWEKDKPHINIEDIGKDLD